MVDDAESYHKIKQPCDHHQATIAASVDFDVTVVHGRLVTSAIITWV